MGFRDDFVWGAATASYQVEGAAFEDGRGYTVWDDFCRRPGKTFRGENGDVACDHYHRYKEDVALMRALNLKAYRFSIAWSRILPEGAGDINPKGLAFYSNLVDALLENGITPYVTLFHWDLPYALYRRGGWQNPDSPEWFARYTKVVADALGGRVKHFITFNEPQCFIGLGHATGEHAPGDIRSRRALLEMAHNVLLAHGRAVQVLREKVPGAAVGYAPTGGAHYPASDSPADIEAARTAYFATSQNPDNILWDVSWWSDPVMLGAYPEKALALYETDMPVIGLRDMETIAQPLDFYAQNIYNGGMVRASGNEYGWEFVERPEGYARTAIGWPVTPESLYWGPKFLYERYKRPIYITENGLSAHDWVDLDGQVHDPNRIDFLRRYLRELRRASEDGVDIRGYFAWSLMDNFEWSRGYSERFGLIHVDYETQKRTIKDSGYWYRELIAANGAAL